MATFANKFNKVSFNIDTTDYNYITLGEVYNSKKNGGGDVIHPINGVFVNKSQFGDSPVIIDVDNQLLVNLPKHMGETIREILADREAVQAIKENTVGYVIYEYESHGRKCYSINFIDVTPAEKK